MRGDLVRKMAARCLTAGLAVLAFLALGLTSATWWGLALTTGAVASAWVERRIRPKTDLVAESILLAAGILVAYARQIPGGFHWTLALTAAALLGLILLERPLREAGALEIRSANLDVRGPRLPGPDGLGTVILVLLVALAAGAAVELPAWSAMLATLLVGAGGAGIVVPMARRRLKPSAAHGRVGQALRRHRPEFLLHFSAPPGSEYQVTMWLPYLERIGRPFVVVLREPEFLAPIAAATRAPVVFCPTLPALDEIMVPSLKVAFYVNHGAKNSHCIRFPQLTHIQIHHGDSDKAPSANPVTAIFDKNFVAGQAAIDRYARAGVRIPPEKFVIVGRPQVESIEVTTRHVRDAAPKVVLYTPTWTGHYADANYCSLPVGETLLQRLLARGVTVLLRAHPYTGQNPQSARQLARLEELLAADRARTGRQHMWGAQTAGKMTLVECVNRSDALVSDVSGVISDYLYSGKPYAVTDMVDDGDRFAERFPLARGGYVLRPDMSNIDSALDRLLDEDPLEDVRRRLRSHYLGDFPAESYADGFLDAARAFLGPQTEAPPEQRSAAPAEPRLSPANG
ncbi:CDP-Glycerol:Poly(glycerophosphate) glycerophosphotransferase [Micromonospora pattaloongensis]|uniref:CDP-Glycerol:Poly(Glycerophosphate) glycerophosphotransferase n=1 Tax=Micromonospora pattaloongensis TaxID=405436 RepID=A0A1H3SKK5_9ACTN|nr:CDP-glycerol glycerophosphotransferase family protein [Micromonospora pattaloongensis]SDZ38081.1 CDP-Glycerol:Poly(glycerophosphate) glycerophosphotransferase [Micromonospora pattaloongensis]